MKAASLQKQGTVDIIRPSWILDCIRQSEIDAGLPDLLLPFEPRYGYNHLQVGVYSTNTTQRHIFFATKDREEEAAANVDRFNDSYARDTTKEELRDVSVSHP